MTKDEFSNTAFNNHLADHKLMGARCEDCGALYLPPRPMCTACFGKQMSWVEMSGAGKLAAFTAIHIAPTAMIEAGYGRNNPYIAGIIQLEEGPSISAQVLGIAPDQPEQVVIGTPMKVVFVDRGEGEARRTFLAFEPIR